MFCAKPCLSFTCHYQFEFHYLTRPSFSLHIIPQSRAKIKIKKTQRPKSLRLSID
ncbi:hypothetical protein FORC67_2091 [Listeria monocytogenes]|nr:hypothetical protein FORC67_2091 [Listeria monocytogenes]